MTFGEACTKYLDGVQHSLKPGSFSTEMSCVSRALDVWSKDCDCASFDNDSILSYRRNRSEKGVSNSTINQEVAVIGKVFRRAGFKDPASGLRKLKVPKPMRPLLTPDQVELLCMEADLINKTVGDFMRFLAYTGAREREGLAFMWADFDMSKRMVCIGANGDSKNGRHRFIQCSEALYAFLCSIQFHVKSGFHPFVLKTNSTHRHVLERVRKRCGLEWVGFHDFRHYFASRCVMSGIDFHTIAEWLGHSDSSLLAKRYAHLSDDHRKQQAQRLKFQ